MASPSVRGVDEWPGSKARGSSAEPAPACSVLARRSRVSSFCFRFFPAQGRSAGSLRPSPRTAKRTVDPLGQAVLDALALLAILDLSPVVGLALDLEAGVLGGHDGWRFCFWEGNGPRSPTGSVRVAMSGLLYYVVEAGPRLLCLGCVRACVWTPAEMCGRV
jgi:hypothetical protein